MVRKVLAQEPWSFIPVPAQPLSGLQTRDIYFFQAFIFNVKRDC